MSYHDRLREEINEALDGLATAGDAWNATDQVFHPTEVVW